MTCRTLLILSLFATACVDDDNDDSFPAPDTDAEIDTDMDLDTSLDGVLCDRASRGAIESYDSGRTVDEAPIIDLEEQAASIAVDPNGGFVGFQPTLAGGFTFGRSVDSRFQVIDLFGRQPEFVEDVRDTGCVEMPIRSTYILEAEQYWLLIDAGIPFVTVVGEPVDIAMATD